MRRIKAISETPHEFTINPAAKKTYQFPQMSAPSLPCLPFPNQRISPLHVIQRNMISQSRHQHHHHHHEHCVSPPDISTSLAVPKSDILACPRVFKRMLAGFISRCIVLRGSERERGREQTNEIELILLIWFSNPNLILFRNSNPFKHCDRMLPNSNSENTTLFYNVIVKSSFH